MAMRLRGRRRETARAPRLSLAGRGCDPGPEASGRAVAARGGRVAAPSPWRSRFGSAQDFARPLPGSGPKPGCLSV